MAYAALVSLAQTIELTLSYRQDSVPGRLKNQTASIDRYVIFLQTFLEQFPDNANSLEGRIRKIAHVAEDVIEFLMSDELLSLSQGLPGGNYDNLRFYSHELKEVTKEIESIAEKVIEIKNGFTVKDARVSDSSHASSSSSRVAPSHKDAMVGFDDDLVEIMSRLCRESSKREVVPIVGMGGIGKTTLARNVYDHSLIVKHFDICAWVTISQDYSVQEIVSALLVPMKVFNTKSKSMGAQRVYQILKGRRYLIVLDDIWSTKAWDDLQVMFPDDGNGSRIMLTTRQSDVARYADSSSLVHEMRLLDEDRSWDLLLQKVFKRGPCPVELEYVGKMIARSCRGLPLAIVVISGILSTIDRTKGAWENIARDVKSAISAKDEQFDKILSLSYTHLPHHLRPCFLYMAGFPEDYEMRVSRLIKLWVAEGFLKNGCNTSFEETAEEYLEDLVKRSLVFVTKRNYCGRIKSFGMHDLMREMCIRKTQEENFFLHVSWFLQQSIKRPRRLCIFHNDQNFLEDVYTTIRTIICSKDRYSWQGIGHFRLLRILDLLDSHGYKYHQSYLPNEIFTLFHLRYLACNCLFEIPSDISNLQNLQTLIIGPRIYLMAEIPPFFVRLPEEMWGMPQLRHLLFCGSLPFPEGAAVALENLHTLSVARDFICTPEILRRIPNLKKLGLSYSGFRGLYKKVRLLHNLVYLQQLENLKLEMQSNFPHWEKVKPAFPMTLKKLTLSGLGLPWEDLRIVGSLPNLEVLKLRRKACVGHEWETAEGEFSQLKVLLINDSDLEQWITESSHFPMLKCLVLRFCSCLSEIPEDIGEISTLELIDVNYNQESLLESAIHIQDYQRSCGNDALQVMAYKSF